MKVRELIEALSKMPGDAQVFVTDETDNWTDNVCASEMKTISVYDPIEDTATDRHNVVVIF